MTSHNDNFMLQTPTDFTSITCSLCSLPKPSFWGTEDAQIGWKPKKKSISYGGLVSSTMRYQQFWQLRYHPAQWKLHIATPTDFTQITCSLCSFPDPSFCETGGPKSSGRPEKNPLHVKNYILYNEISATLTVKVWPNIKTTSCCKHPLHWNHLLIQSFYPKSRVQFLRNKGQHDDNLMLSLKSLSPFALFQTPVYEKLGTKNGSLSGRPKMSTFIWRICVLLQRNLQQEEREGGVAHLPQLSQWGWKVSRVGAVGKAQE